MVLENTKCNKVINKSISKCGFCGKELKPIGYEYLYKNISPYQIEYERCNCIKAKEYWQNEDKKNYLAEKQKHYKQIIDKIYKENYMEKRFQKYNFENFNINVYNEKSVEIAKDFIDKIIKNDATDGLIITGKSGVGKTHLAASIAKKLIENDKIVLMGRLNALLDMIKETFKDNTKSEKELIDLYSNVDMIIIDDLGTERISQWVLEKFYTIIENRIENKLPIIITTRFNKDGLINRFKQSQDEELVNAVIAKLYQNCYGIILKNEKKLAEATN